MSKNKTSQRRTNNTATTINETISWFCFRPITSRLYSHSRSRASCSLIALNTPQHLILRGLQRYEFYTEYPHSIFKLLIGVFTIFPV